MSTLEELRKEQDTLRQALVQLERVLVVSIAPEAVQQQCRSVMGLLQVYVQKEEEAVALYANRIQAVMRQQGTYDHADPRVVLHDLRALTTVWASAPTREFMIHLRRLMDELRERLEEEERDIFPVVESAEAGVLDYSDGLKKQW